MLSRFLRFWIYAAIEDKGMPCPKCGSTNTDKQNGIWHCYDCQKEW